MKQLILDTSFIITAVKQKLDFFDDNEVKGMEVVVPEQTIKELKGLGAKLELSILEKNDFTLIKFPGKDADAAIINFAKENPNSIVATLDRGLQKKIKNKKLIIRQRRRLEII